MRSLAAGNRFREEIDKIALNVSVLTALRQAMMSRASDAARLCPDGNQPNEIERRRQT
jgi:hypothetical protein